MEIFPKRSGLGSEIICPDCLKGLVCLVHVLVESAMFGLLVVEIVTFFFSSPEMVIPKMNRPPNRELYLCLDLFLDLYENKRKTCLNKKVRVKNWR